MRITPDEARVLRYAAANLRNYANEPFTSDGSAHSLRYQAHELDEMTNEYPDDWPVARGARVPLTPRCDDSAKDCGTVASDD